jgi:hypothetical protein
MKLDSVSCEIEFLPLVSPEPEEDRTSLAKRVHDMVSAKYRPFHPQMNSNASLQDQQTLSTI